MTKSPEFPRGHVLPALLVLHDREPRSAAMNMAVDEALLQTTSRPVLRFYSWRQPALSFGYFGRFCEVADQAPQREIVRRWTGGGIVPHGADQTYSIILPRGNLEMPSPQTIYRHIHGAIREALAAHLEVDLARDDAPKISDACFANAVTADVMMRGRKIAGAAQRRTRAGLLHQGSIQYQDLPATFRDAFAAALCHEFEAITLTREATTRAQNLAAQKYGTAAWLRRR